MNYFYLFLIAGSVLVFLILQFDKQQRRKVDMLLKNTNDVQPLLMMQYMGQKLDKINTALDAKGTDRHTRGSIKHEIEQQLQQLKHDYNCGNISIQNYDNKLGELLEKIAVR